MFFQNKLSTLSRVLQRTFMGLVTVIHPRLFFDRIHFSDTREPKLSTTYYIRKRGVQGAWWLRQCLSVTMALDLIPWSYSSMRRSVGLPPINKQLQFASTILWGHNMHKMRSRKIICNQSSIIDGARNSISVGSICQVTRDCRQALLDNPQLGVKSVLQLSRHQAWTFALLKQYDLAALFEFGSLL